MPTAAGQNSSRGRSGSASPEVDTAAELDHVDAINQVFAEFEFAYHNQFHKAFASQENLAIAKKYWLSCLEHMPPRHIVMAAKRVIRDQDYLPSISVILRACEQGFDLYGLPGPRQAYVEACAAPAPKADFEWSHEAVYHAGRASGWFLLANEPEAVAYPVFEHHYQVLCRRVMAGEQLSAPSPPPLPEKVSRALSAEEKRARLARLRAELDL